MRKILRKIMNDLELYCPNFYDDRNCADTQTISSFINDLTDVPYLAAEKENVCQGTLEYDQSYNELQTFNKYIPHRNHGLTVEFYLAFWPLFGDGSLRIGFVHEERKNDNTFPFIVVHEML